MADLRVERNALRKQISTLEGRLADQAALLKHYTGEALPFPDDLDPLYREEALMERFTAALEAVGADGEVTEIDCSEFPCVVYGKVNGEDGTQLDRLRSAEPLAPYKDEWGNTSIWGGKAMVDGKPSSNAVFGIAFMPKGSVDEGVLGKRLRFRHQIYWEAAKADLHPPAGDE